MTDSSIRRRIAAYRLHATHDSRELTAPARKAFLDKFETLADPEGTLDPTERQRRARLLKKAYFTELALKSAEARRR